MTTYRKKLIELALLPHAASAPSAFGDVHQRSRLAQAHSRPMGSSATAAASVAGRIAAEFRAPATAPSERA